MWFKRKPKNRRLGREFVLDVKLRSSQVRAARARLAATALALIFTLVLGGLALWRTGGWALDELVYTNKAFAIQEVEVQTDGAIAPAQLRRWCGVRPGENLLALDLARVKRDLEMVSTIQSASVERVLPHTLRIRVIEREPLARIRFARPATPRGIESAVYQVDPDGYVMLPLEAQQRSAPPALPEEQLPVLSGPKGTDVQPGHRLESPQVQAALRLLLAFERSPMAGLVELKQVETSVPDVLIVTTGQESEITFGLGDPEPQLRRWQSVYEYGQKYGKAIATLDLAVSNCLPARWLEASAVPPVTPKPLKIPKKRHV